mgnify:CR=1 FL=1
MKLIIVTGMSGAGKSKAVDCLEDAGFYCLDNLPVKLLATVLNWMRHNTEFPKKVAITLDIRSKDISESFFAALESVKNEGIPTKVLFLDCEDAVLLKRYKESRRLHPLMNPENLVDLSSAISEERKLLAGVRESADYILDTTKFSTSQLKISINGLLDRESKSEGMLLQFMSFGYKYGLPAEADLVFDVRCLPNPFYVEELKLLNGTDAKVQHFVLDSNAGQEVLSRIAALLTYTIPLYEAEGRARLVVAFGCTGGQHRSTAFACRLKDMFAKNGREAELVFRDLDTNTKEIKSR